MSANVRGKESGKKLKGMRLNTGKKKKERGL